MTVFAPLETEYIVLRIDPVAVAEILEDPILLDAAKSLTPKSYLAYVAKSTVSMDPTVTSRTKCSRHQRSWISPCRTNRLVKFVFSLLVRASRHDFLVIMWMKQCASRYCPRPNILCDVGRSSRNLRFPLPTAITTSVLITLSAYRYNHSNRIRQHPYLTRR